MFVFPIAFSFMVYAVPPVYTVQVKCPSEYIGIETPTTYLVHKAVDTGISCINNTKLLPYEVKKVCA